MKLIDLKKFEFTPLNILKLAGVVVVGIVIISIILSIFGSVVRKPHMGGPGMPMYDEEISARPAGVAYIKEMAQRAVGYGADGYDGDMVMLSARNAASSFPAPLPPMYPQGTTGDTAEEFEVTEYSASFESRDKDETCDTIKDLKSRSFVIFESANEHDRGCNYTFKVLHANVSEILSFIESMDPKDLNENTYTIKNQVDDFTSETEILEKKLASIDETLENAIDAYDEIQRIATNSQDAEALARIIDSKLQLIERLTQERINVNEQLDRYSRLKDEQLDRLEYTYFHISVFERAFVNGEEIADSWKESVRQFFYDLNQIAQDLTVNLILLLVMAVQWILYALILIVIAKYVWKAAKYIWNR
jgi:hypothetical protein